MTALPTVRRTATTPPSSAGRPAFRISRILQPAAAIVVAAVLESAFAVCLGCHAFALLMRAGVVPESVCLECADVRGRLDRLAAAG